MQIDTTNNNVLTETMISCLLSLAVRLRDVDTCETAKVSSFHTTEDGEFAVSFTIKNTWFNWIVDSGKLLMKVDDGLWMEVVNI